MLTAPPTWRGRHATGTLDAQGGIAIAHSDGTTAYLQPGDVASDLASTLDSEGITAENTDVLLTDFLPE